MAKGRPTKHRSAAKHEAPSAPVAARPGRPAEQPARLLDVRADSFRMSDILSALRREVSTAAAAAGADGVPGLAIANVDFELAYVVADANPEGVWVALNGPAMKEAGPSQINRLRVSVLDVEVAALSDSATRRRSQG